LVPEEEQRERQRHWQALSPAGRAVWGWPSPGEPLDQEAPFPPQIEDGSPPPHHLLLLRIALEQVELLELHAHPHRRRRWRATAAWREEELNP
jgi:pyridoxamine 5'-phosphate oxidase